MGDFSGLGRGLFVLGIFLVAVGGVLWRWGRIPFLGQLPGDIVFRKGSTTVYFPVVTSILLSIILTLILAFLSRRS